MSSKQDIQQYKIKQNDNQEKSLLNQNQQQQNHQRTDPENFLQSSKKNSDIHERIGIQNQDRIEQSSENQQINLADNQQQEKFKQQQLEELVQQDVNKKKQALNKQYQQESYQFMQDQQQKEKICYNKQQSDADSNITLNQNKIIKQTNSQLFEDNQQKNSLIQQSNNQFNQTSNINNLNQTQQQQNANHPLIQNNQDQSIKQEEQFKQSNQNKAKKQQSQSQKLNSKTILFPDNDNKQIESNECKIINFDYNLPIDIPNNIGNDIVAYAGNIFNEFNKNNLIFYYDDRDKLQIKSSKNFLSQSQIANFQQLKIKIDNFFIKLSEKNNFDDLYYVTRKFIKLNKI